MGNISGEQTLSSLFNGNFYRIPDYQRGYAWQDRKESNDKEHQLDDFWDDLLNLANHNLLNPQEKHKHYTGVLSLERVGDKEKEKPQWAKDEVAKNGEAYYIVDGQQRITTSIILLKVILDFVDSNKLNEFAGEETQDLHKKYIGKMRNGEKYYFFGYTFDNPSYEFLKTQIFGDKSSTYKDEKSIYTKNLAFAKEFFSEKINAENAEIIFKTLTENFVFNVYKISNDFDVYVAFETMNNRGKPLSSLELLKNRLIYLSTKLNGNEKGEKLRKDINEHWKVIYQYLGKNDENVLEDDDFLQVHWLMYFNEYNRDKATPYRDFLLKKYFTINNLNGKEINAKTINDYTENLRDCVEHYYFLYNLDDTDYKRNNKISNDSEMLVWLEKIQRLNFGAFEPLLVAVLYKRTENLKKGLNNDRDIVELLKNTLKSFCF